MNLQKQQQQGTFCVVHAVLEKYRQDLAKGIEEPEVNILDTILHFRRQVYILKKTKIFRNLKYFLQTATASWYGAN